ncbi:MAG: glycosyltransferase family 4 protein [Candidatus Aminicenantes bacterium]|nr:glycosyltransferase family 4 protein [Candidatus Aminicenantes bacterium]
MTEKPRIAIIHPHLIEAGGSEARALHAAEALEGDYDVTLITMGHPDLGRLNRYYGTHLSADRIRIVSFPIPVFARNHFDALRSYRVSRYCRTNASRFDLMISTYNIMDFGVKGIQFIADFSFDDVLRERDRNDPRTLVRAFYRSRIIRGPYLSLARALSRTSKDGWKRNLTIANSDWTAWTLREAFGIEICRIYPPVVNVPPGVPWDEREPGFVYLGRISPEKDIESIIGILKAVRECRSDIHLHIVGDSNDPGYMNRIRALCQQNAAWAFLEGQMAGEEKAAFVGRHRFGISACWNEAFGIAVAEMVKAGCLVWVPASGGQTEIVGRPELIYSAREDAVGKIGRVLRDGNLQAALREHLGDRKKMFSLDRFAREVRAVVSDFLKDRHYRGDGLEGI